MNMKIKLFICIAALSLFILSCGGNKSEQPEATAETAETATASDPIQEGKQLVSTSDCNTCHHATNKIIGPSHTDVAKKYEFTAANVDLIADHIIKGGSGVWGDIPMTAHPDLSVEDAKKMARYVLSLDGETEK